jgi:hypothetical protein
VIPKLGFRIPASACLGLLLLLVATARPAAAQDEVSAYSKLAVFPDPPTIVAYSITEINAAAAADGYTPDIAARLEADGTVVAEADPDTNDPGNSLVAGTLKNGNTTECQLDQGAVLGACVALEIYPQQADVSTYVLVGYHYLLAPEIEETGCYDDSAGFGLDPGEDFMPGDSDPGEGDWEGPGGGDVCLTEVEAEIYLGYSTDQFSGTAPTINSTSLQGASLGSSGTITVDGQNLETDYDDDEAPTPAMTDPTTGQPSSGVSVSVATSPAPTAQEVTLNYSILSSASTGPQNLTLATLFGASNPAKFTVGDPTPVITSINGSSSAPTWVAGNQYSVTIGGTGFGTNPSLTITGGGMSGCSGVTMSPPGASCSIQSAADTQIQATVIVPSNAPGGQATVQVQSNGYNGSGWMSTQSGQSNTATAPATIQAATLPPPAAPQIMFGPDSPPGSICASGSNVAGTDQDVVVGQLVAFTACIPTLPQGTQIQSASWSPAAPASTDAVGGYSVSSSQQSGQVVQLSTTTCGVASYCDFAPFYWVNQQTGATFTFTYTITNGQQAASASASISFDVDGPGGVSVTVNPFAPNVPLVNIVWSGGFPSLKLGGGSGPQGTNAIFFQAATTYSPASGSGSSFLWVQLISQYEVLHRLSPSGATQTCNPAALVFDSNPKLDSVYPFWQGLLNLDSPSTSAVYSEVAASFAATMYLLWDPALPSGCTPASVTAGGVSTPSNCSGSIPVPLGYVPWSWSGDAIDTSGNETTFNVGSCSSVSPASESASAFQASSGSSGYPTWAGSPGSIPSNVSFSQFMTCSQ